MNDERPPLHSGGCQCGAVRYALHAEPFDAHICHCRMCQKAFGGFYAPLTKVARDDLTWTRGAPANFRSSPDVDRGFCADCGTPLTFDHLGSPYINVAIGSLDHPEKARPKIQIGIESRVPWHDVLPALDERLTEQILSPERQARVQNHQHPDHDTESWSKDP